MRTRVKASLALVVPLVAALVAAGCTSAEGDGGDSPTRGGSLTVGLAAIPPQLDAFTTPANPRSFFIRAVYSTLVQTTMAAGSDGKVTVTDQPYVAESWTQTDPNTWEFTLKQGLTFPNGEPLDSSAVKFSFDYVMDEENNKDLSGRFGAIDHVEAPDSQTFRVVTKSPTPLLPRTMAMLPIVAPKAFQEMGEEAYWANPVGTGSWKVETFQPQERVVLVPNEHAIAPQPLLDRLTFEVIPEPAARVAALRAGDVDAINLVSPDDTDPLRNAGFNIVAQVEPSTYLVDLLQPSGPLSDVRVRQAINYAVDKQSIIDNVMRGLGAVSQGQLIPDYVTGFCSDVKAYEYDPEKAKQLLADAGVEPGQLKLRFQSSQGFFLNDNVMAQAIQEMLGKVGIEVELDVMEFSNYLDVYYGDAPRADLFGWRPSATPLLDVSVQAARFTSTYSTHNIGYSNPEYDRLVKEAASAPLGSAERQEGYCQAAKLLRDEAPVLFVVHTPDIWALSDKVEGFELPGDANPLFEKLSVAG